MEIIKVSAEEQSVMQIQNNYYKVHPSKIKEVFPPKDVYFLVDPRNAYFSSLNGCLYSFNGKTLIKAFKNNCQCLYIPNEVQRIGRDAFYTSEIKNVIALNVETVDDNAFAYSKVENVCFSEKLQKIQVQCFQNSNIQCIDLSRTNIKEIFFATFDYCKHLHEIQLPQDIVRINAAFTGCISLKTINIHRCLKCDEHFLQCKKLESIQVSESNPNYRSIDGVLYSKDMSTLYRVPINWKLGKIKEFHIPETVNKISDYAFEGCKFEKITISEGVEVLPEGVFQNCKKLNFVALPTSLIKIFPNAFCQCKRITDILIPRNVKIIYRNAFRQSGLQNLELFGDTNIQNGAFNYCHNLDVLKIHTEISKQHGIFNHQFKKMLLPKGFGIQSPYKERRDTYNIMEY